MGYSGAILRNGEGKVLFQLRDEKGKNPNRWGIFGGGIEKREKPLEALFRELREELGVNISESDILREYKIPLINYHIFEVNLRYSQNEIEIKEGKDMKFMTIREFLDQKDSLLRVKIFFKLFGID